MKYMFSCKDISKISSEERKLNFVERLKFKLHLFICNDCQNFVTSMRELTRLAKNNIIKKMDIEADEITRIENEIIKKVSK